MDFNELDWHDAVIKKINFDRTPAENDSVAFDMVWPNGEQSTVVFTGLRHADLSLNFGYAGSENVAAAYLIESNDEVDAIKSKWLDCGVNSDIKCYTIETGTTGGIIKLFAESFSVKNNALKIV